MHKIKLKNLASRNDGIRRILLNDKCDITSNRRLGENKFNHSKNENESKIPRTQLSTRTLNYFSSGSINLELLNDE